MSCGLAVAAVQWHETAFATDTLYQGLACLRESVPKQAKDHVPCQFDVPCQFAETCQRSVSQLCRSLLKLADHTFDAMLQAAAPCCYAPATAATTEA